MAGCIRSRTCSFVPSLLRRAGAVFKRKKYVLGINSGTEQIHMKLSSDEQTYVSCAIAIIIITIADC